MKKSNSKGVANHADPESWVVVRKVGGQALTGGRAGLAIELRKSEPAKAGDIGGADLVRVGGRPHRGGRHRKTSSSLTQSENQGTYGNTAHGNREIPRSSAEEAMGREADRIGKSKDSSR